MAAPGVGATASATEQGSKLAELLNQEAGKMGRYELKVLRSEIVEYQWNREFSEHLIPESDFERLVSSRGRGSLEGSVF